MSGFIVYQDPNNGGDKIVGAFNPLPVKSSPTDPVYSSLSTSLSKELDSIDVGRLSKGAVTIAHNAISANTTSSEIDCRGYNALLVQVTTITGTWENKVLGSLTSGGTFNQMYDYATLMTTGAITAGRTMIFRGIPDFVKIDAIVTVAGSVTVKVQPLNI